LNPAEGNRPPFLSGIILAAGSSTRMGRAKQLLPLENRPLLQHVVDSAAASCLDEIVLVLGYRAEEIRAAIHCPAGVRVVVNTAYAEGQSTSLCTGLRAASPGAQAAAVLLGDQPRVTAQLIDLVATAFAKSAACVARPVYAGVGGRRVPGHPVFLARRVWPETTKLRGDQGARALLLAHPEWVCEVSVEGEAPRDVDTWEDYRSSAGRAASPAAETPDGNSRGGT
jgi:molybdenum cofactor cytidylyltransferase